MRLITLTLAALVMLTANAARRVGKLLMPEDAVCRVAVFTVPVNTEDGDVYTGFELCDSAGFFYSQSEIADETFGACDKMRLFVCTSQGGNPRRYTPIGNTLSWTNRLTTVVAVVDLSCILRNRGDWFRSDNAELEWSYLRGKPVDPPVEFEDGTESGQWRPLSPVWLKELPSWAK